MKSISMSLFQSQVCLQIDRMRLALFRTIDRRIQRAEISEHRSTGSLPCQRSFVSALDVARQRCIYPPHERSDFIMSRSISPPAAALISLWRALLSLTKSGWTACSGIDGRFSPESPLTDGWARFRRAKVFNYVPGGRVSHARMGAFSIDKNMLAKPDSAASTGFSGKEDLLDWLLPPYTRWDQATGKALEDAAEALGRLTWFLLSVDLAPVELMPLVALKAVDAYRLDGYDYSLLDLYKTSRLLRPEAAQTEIDRLIHDYLRALNEIGSLNKDDSVDLGKAYQQLSPEHSPRYRTEAAAPLFDELPAPPCEALPARMAALTAFLQKPSVAHPLLRLAVVYAELVRLQPVPESNTPFALYLLDLLLARWCQLPDPVLNLAGCFRAQESEYRQSLLAYLAGGTPVDWFQYFFKAVHQAAQSATDLMIRHQAVYHNLLRQLFATKLDASPEQVAAFLMSNPVFSPHLLGQTWLKHADGVQLVEILLEIGLIEVIDASGEEALYACRRALAFWDPDGIEGAVA